MIEIGCLSDVGEVHDPGNTPCQPRRELHTRDCLIPQYGHKKRHKPVKAKTSKTSTSTPSKATITRMASRRKPDASAAELLAAEGINVADVIHELQQLSPVNASRVVKLHDRIEAGEYKLDSKRIAEKLMKFEKSLEKP